MQPKSKPQSKANSTTRSLDTRSTSCDREEELGPILQRHQQKQSGVHFTMAQPFKSKRGVKKQQDYPDLSSRKIETVLEEEETEVGMLLNSES